MKNLQLKTQISNRQAGFTVVELLVTLFVAVVFLAASYVLFSAVINDSASARMNSQASAIANEILYKKVYESQPCNVNPQTQTISPPTNHRLDNPQITATISAPYASLT